MRQVFFSNSAVEAAGGDTASRFSDLSNNKLGLWDPYAQTGGDWFANALFDNRFITADTDTDDGDASDIAVTTASITKRVLPLKQAIQVAQGFPSGNPLASPIISADKLVSVRTNAYKATVRHEQRITPVTGDGGDEMMIKFVIKQHPTSYLGYVNGESSIFDLSGENRDFPLSGFHANNHKVINISFTASATVATSTARIKAAIEKHNVLDDIVDCDDQGTHIDILARHPGTVFDIIMHNESDDAAANSQVALQGTGYDPGIGNPWQARADELKARAQAGNHNRMYFPQTFEDYVKGTGANYQFDRFEIVYKIDGDRDVVKGSQFGTIVIYEKDGTDSLKDVLNMGTALTQAGTDYLF